MAKETEQTIHISKEGLERLMTLCFGEGISCGADEKFWYDLEDDSDISNYISKRVKALLDAAGIQ